MPPAPRIATISYGPRCEPGVRGKGKGYNAIFELRPFSHCVTIGGVIELQSQDLLQVAVRLLAATAIGSGIGLDREVRHKPAGLKTHALVSLGAALLTLIIIRTGPSSFQHVDAISRV